MKEKIGFLCIGQAGGNIGQLLEQNGYNCLFINTSEEDLNTINVKYRYHIEGGEGCSHDRENAITLVKRNYKRIVEEVNDKLYHQQLIYLIFSSGGGTGSGSAPLLLEILNSAFPERCFGCVTILPALSETTKVNMNAYNCYKEITQIEKLASVFTLDNDKMDRFQLNNSFVNLFNMATSITNHISPKSNIDKRELWKLLTTRGNTIISSCTSSDPSNLASGIIKSWETNIFTDIEPDKLITYMGLSLTADIDLEDLKKVIGIPFDVFINYNSTSCITILSGLTFPKSRIDRLIDNLNRNKDSVKSSLLNSKTNKITSSLDWFEESQPEPSKVIDLDEILSKY